MHFVGELIVLFHLYYEIQRKMRETVTCDCILYKHTGNRLPGGGGAFERIPTGDDAPDDDDDDDDDGVTRARTHARVVVAGFRRPGVGFVGRDEYIHT